MRIRRPLEAAVASRLNSVGTRWQWLLFWRLLSALIMAFAAIFLLLGWGLHREWTKDSLAVGIFVFLLVVFFGLGVVVIGMVALSRKRPNSWLAARIERALPTLLDRLNTLTHLEPQPKDDVTAAYFEAIGKQAGRELGTHPKARPISAGWTVGMLLLALGLWIGVIQFYLHYRPWEALVGGRTQIGQVEDALELNLPKAEDSSEVREAWGEVRITEPGGDLKLTKVDVLPLTIEAASSQQLEHASWSHAVNGQAPARTELPKPDEPNYAVYQPTIYLDELNLSDWDVVSYFANATSPGAQYASEIYFVEIRPFREDLLKLENNGGGGASGECLKKLSRLIQKQQDILRQTYRQEQKPAKDSEQQKTDQDKLTAAETDLEKATAHLYAEIAELENQDVATVLDKLAEAQGSMGGAIEKLAAADNPNAKTWEQLALQQLAESRKDFVKRIQDGGQGGDGSPDEEKPPVAGMKPKPDEELSDITDFRDAQKAARAGVEALREKQEAIAREARNASDARLAELQQQQQTAARELTELQEKIPQPFAEAKEKSAAARGAMDQAGQSFENGKAASLANQKAAQALADLGAQLAGNQTRRSLGDAYRLNSLMENQATELQKMATQTEPIPPADAARAGAEAKAAKDALARTLDETPAGKAFGPSLGEALSGEPGQQLDAAAGQLQPGNAPDSKSALDQARQSLEKITSAFAASKPATLQGEGKAGSPGENAMNDAVRNLNSLIQRLTEKRSTSAENLRKQLEDARMILQTEAKSNPEEVPQLLAVMNDLEKMTDKVDLHVDADALRKLVDRLESYRLEMADHQRAAPVDPTLLHANPDEVPAEFRDRVRQYFEKLSDG